MSILPFPVSTSLIQDGPYRIVLRFQDTEDDKPDELVFILDASKDDEARSAFDSVKRAGTFRDNSYEGRRLRGLPELVKIGRLS